MAKTYSQLVSLTELELNALKIALPDHRNLCATKQEIDAYKRAKEKLLDAAGSASTQKWCDESMGKETDGKTTAG
jgi:hypothetical protein